MPKLYSKQHVYKAPAPLKLKVKRSQWEDVTGEELSRPATSLSSSREQLDGMTCWNFILNSTRATRNCLT